MKTIARVITIKAIVPECLHHFDLNEGERKPMNAYMRFEKPITGVTDARMERDAIQYPTPICHFFRYGNTKYNDKRLASKWKILP
jgi:hypothetical protein